METAKKIHRQAMKQLARGGYEGVSLRSIAKGAGIAPSVVYYHYKDKDAVLKSMFRRVSKDLGQARRALRPLDETKKLLAQRVEFQLDHMEEIVAVLKFYLAKRSIFPKINGGYVPLKTYQHIEEVLEHGKNKGDIIDLETSKEAKVITHAINGFLLEFYPSPPKGQEKQELINTITNFIWRSIAKKD